MLKAIRPLVLFVLLLSLSKAQAQLPELDVTSRPFGSDQVEVVIRPDGFFDGLFSSIVFTLRWDNASGVSLGEPLQDIPQVQYCSVFKSDVEQVDGDQRYQIFVGFGSITLSTLSASWTAGEEIVLCRIPLVGGAVPVLLVDDTWTTANNGSYYVSLNGEDRTGVIYGSSTAVQDIGEETADLSVFPNPARNMTRIVLTGQQASPNVLFRVMDASGREVRSWHRNIPAGTYEEVLDLSAFSSGIHAVEVDLPGGRITQRMVIE